MNLKPISSKVILQADSIRLSDLLESSSFAPFIVSAISNGLRLMNSDLDSKDVKNLDERELDEKGLRHFVKAILYDIPYDDRYTCFKIAGELVHKSKERKRHEFRQAVQDQLNSSPFLRLPIKNR